MQFDWDKANRNHLKRHHVRSEELEQAMSNEPLDLEWEDVEGEIRYHAVGETDGGRVPVHGLDGAWRGNSGSDGIHGAACGTTIMAEEHEVKGKTIEDPRLDPEWYYRNREQLGRRAAATIRSGKAKRLTREKLAARLKASKETRPITLRVRTEDIELAKEQAEKKGLGYQTYLKSLLHQALHAK